MAETLGHLFEANREWVRETRQRDPRFFLNLAAQQSPEYLWIGCADSRVPPNEIVKLNPGELFVHRNVANVVVHSDLNCLSVLQYAVEVLKVTHVIVCGHYGCGGVRAAMEDKRHGLIDNWLRHIQDVGRKYRTELDAIEDEHARFDRLCELNVIEQLLNVAETTTVQEAWDRGQRVVLHGWIYGLHDGLMRDLGVSGASNDELARKCEAAGAGWQR